MRRTFACITIMSSLALLAGQGVAAAAEQPGVRAVIQAAAQRKPAPAFRLTDASGKTVSLSSDRGKIVLLDFWATECGGCKAEIPWFMEFSQTYKPKGLEVVGVSMDILYEDLKNAQEGWSRVTPFVREHKGQLFDPDGRRSGEQVLQHRRIAGDLPA